MKRERISQYLFALSNKLRRTIDKKHQAFGISGGQSRVLNFIYRHSKNNDVFQKDIETFFSIRSSSATEIVKKLLNLKLIKRTVLKEDKRMKKLELTEEGLKIVAQTFKILDAIEKEFKEKVSKQDYKNLVQSLDIFELIIDKKEDSNA